MNTRVLKIPATVRLLPILLLLVLPAVVQAQFNYVITNATLTITKYTGPGGMVNIPDTYLGWPVTSIGDYAFFENPTVTGVTIGNNVTNIGNYAFFANTNLASVTFGNSVSTIEYYAFTLCTNLTSVTIPASVSNIYTFAFLQCSNLTGAYFQGNAPTADTSVFRDDPVTVYYLPGTTGWGTHFGGAPTWNPQVQTGDGSFGVRTNQFGFKITGNNNLVVVVEASVDLVSPVWSPVATNTLTGGTSYFSDPQWTNYPERFYRLRSP